MNRTACSTGTVAGVFGAILLVLSVTCAGAVVDGITGRTTFNFLATVDHITTGDGGSVLFWGYGDADGAATAQYPGPTLIVNQGDTITINLTNELPVPVSIVFPGQEGVTAQGVSAPTSAGC